MSVRSHFTNLFTLFSAVTAMEHLKVLYHGNKNESNPMKITFFHGNLDLCKLHDFGWIGGEHEYVLTNFAWAAEGFDHTKHVSCIQRMINSSSNHVKNIIFLAASQIEVDFMSKTYPQCTTFIGSHNIFLKEDLFTLRNPSTPTIIDRANPLCVVSSKPLPMKNHYLSAPIPNKVFVSYINKIRAQEIKNEFNFSKLHFSIPSADVVSVFHEADFGAIFSTAEGACFSSNEYLLTGLPVLSTYSKGGRDFFYDASNSVQVEPNVKAVAAGYEKIKQLIVNPNFNRSKIREGVLAKVKPLRHNLVAHLVERFEKKYGNKFKNKQALYKTLYATMFRENKGKDYQNIFVQYTEDFFNNVKESVLSEQSFL